MRNGILAIAVACGVSAQAFADEQTAIMQRTVKAAENPMIASETWEMLRPDITTQPSFWTVKA